MKRNEARKAYFGWNTTKGNNIYCSSKIRRPCVVFIEWHQSLVPRRAWVNGQPRLSLSSSNMIYYVFFTLVTFLWRNHVAFSSEISYIIFFASSFQVSVSSQISSASIRLFWNLHILQCTFWYCSVFKGILSRDLEWLIIIPIDRSQVLFLYRYIFMSFYVRIFWLFSSKTCRSGSSLGSNLAIAK